MADKITVNRQASFKYHLTDKMEAGIALEGSEVKSLREGHADLGDSYIRHDGEEVFIINFYIKPYQYGRLDIDARRKRKLLLKKKEILKLIGIISRKSYTCVPLSLYFNKRGKVKLEIALAQGKKIHDKREAVKERDHAREMDRARKRSK